MTTRATVLNFDTSEALRRALLNSESQQHSSTTEDSCDWRLPVSDPYSHPQTVDGELQRLLTLKSYLILDSEREAVLDSLTKEACEYFKLPVSLVSLVDLGRQWAISAHGTDCLETCRKDAFCSYTILSKENICVVSDARNDERFAQNAMVTQAPFLRFYAGAPLISPEGYKIGTFCVEGPEPREFGKEDQVKLQEYASKAMKLMVERRRYIQKKMDAPLIDDMLKRHAGVSTNLGSLLYNHVDNDLVLAMRLFQESVQTLMYVKEEGDVGYPPKERQDEMSRILEDNSSESLTSAQIKDLVTRTEALYPSKHGGVDVTLALSTAREHSLGGIPGVFVPYSNLKANHRMSSLLFGETFQISLDDFVGAQDKDRPIEERQFIIPLEQCSKATLFNMGLIHYRWGSPDSAIQFFNLASSFSHQLSPLAFDPVILASINNMAQINLQFSRPDNAMEYLTDALARGNAALATMYGEVRHDKEILYDDERRQASEVRRSRRLRRKLSRTLLNIAHVHYFRSEFDQAIASCRDVLKLLHTNTDDPEVAAVWYNMGMLEYHLGRPQNSIQLIDKYLSRASVILGPSHLQVSGGLLRKGQILFEAGSMDAALEQIEHALRIRRAKVGGDHVLVAEALGLKGKVLLAKEAFAFSLEPLTTAVGIFRKFGGGDGIPLDAAQIMLDLGRSLHANNRNEDAISIYREVLEIAKAFFGPKHEFVGRVAVIIGKIHIERGHMDAAIAELTIAAEIQLEREGPSQQNKTVQSLVNEMITTFRKEISTK